MIVGVLFAVIGILLVLLCMMSLIFLRGWRDVISHADKTHERVNSLLSETLDRVMAEDFQAFKGWQATQLAEPGSYEEPPESEEVPVGIPWHPEEEIE